MNLNLPYAAWLTILAVILATTFGPITIRVAQLEGVPSVYIISARLLLTSLVLAPVALRRQDVSILWQMNRQDWLWTGLAGFFLAVNLLMLFLALEYTSVLVTGILRRLMPIWAIGLEMFFLAAIFSRRVWIGVLVTVGGSVAVALGGAGAIEAGSAPAFGALLAIIGSVCMGFYLLIGRKLKDVLPSLTYSWLVFTIAGFCALLATIGTGTPLWGYSATAYFWVLVVTIVSQILGHIALNMTLQYIPATHLSLIMQVSIAASGVVAYFTFNQVPSTWQIAGSLAVIIGVMVATWQPSGVAT